MLVMGQNIKLKKKSVIATLGIGYADGLPRYFQEMFTIKFINFL